jgi:hypothetical protein
VHHLLYDLASRGRAAEQRDELATFHCPVPAVLPTRKDSTPRLRQETAALRDFDPAYDRSGSDSVIRRCRLDVRFAPESGRVADVGARLKSANSDIRPRLRLHLGTGSVTKKVEPRASIALPDEIAFHLIRIQFLSV